jgi:ribonuclease P protein component
MLGRKNRFHGYNSVAPAYKGAKTVRADGCSLHYKPNPRQKEYRLAVVISKKVSKSAVTRNRIRRRLYEIVRPIPISQPYDLIITVFDSELAQAPHQQVQKTVTSLFEKSGITSR